MTVTPTGSLSGQGGAWPGPATLVSLHCLRPLQWPSPEQMCQAVRGSGAVVGQVVLRTDASPAQERAKAAEAWAVGRGSGFCPCLLWLAWPGTDVCIPGAPLPPSVNVRVLLYHLPSSREQ